MEDRNDKLERELDRVAKLILLRGPLTGYGAQEYLQEMKERGNEAVKPGKRDPPLSTVHGHLKILEDEGETIVYHRERISRKRKYYGLTLYGFLWNLSPKIVENRFKQILERWLKQKRFNFFLPKHEVSQAIEEEQVAASLGKFCLTIPESLPDAEDLFEYLRMLGFDESDPSATAQLLINLAGGIGAAKNPRELLQAMRVLCNCEKLPSFRDAMTRFVQNQRSILSRMESELGLVIGDRSQP